MKNKKVSEGLSVEFIKESFYNKDAITPPEIRWRRLNFRGRRYYWNPDDVDQIYPGITGVISRAVPKSYYLEKWEREQVVKAGDVNAGKAYMKRRGIMGTVMHILINNFLSGYHVDLSLIGDTYADEMRAEGIGELDISIRIDEDTEEIKRALLSFFQWVKDYAVKPIACELILKSFRGYASPLDLLAWIDVSIEGYWGEVYKSTSKGKYQEDDPKLSKKLCSIPVVVDFKISKAVYDEYDYQLTGYVELVEEHFPHIAAFELKDEQGIVRHSGVSAYCWHPPAKKWTVTPSYSFTERPIKEDWSQRCDIGVKALQLDVSATSDQVLDGFFNYSDLMESEDLIKKSISDKSIKELLIESLQDGK